LQAESESSSASANELWNSAIHANRRAFDGPLLSDTTSHIEDLAPHSKTNACDRPPPNGLLNSASGAPTARKAGEVGSRGERQAELDEQYLQQLFR
jgi:hypothetical protein